MDSRDYMIAKDSAMFARRAIEALKDLVDFSEKNADLVMLKIIRNHLKAMREEVFKELQLRRK